MWDRPVLSLIYTEVTQAWGLSEYGGVLWKRTVCCLSQGIILFLEIKKKKKHGIDLSTFPERLH